MVRHPNAIHSPPIRVAPLGTLAISPDPKCLEADHRSPISSTLVDSSGQFVNVLKVIDRQGI